MKTYKLALGVCIAALSISTSCFAVHVDIPEGTTEIADYAFLNRTDITSINIPNSVTSIGDNAFSGCSNLKSVILSEGVSLGLNTFDATTEVIYRSSTDTDSDESEGEVDVASAKYCVIDLSAGASASKYEVAYLDSEPESGFNTDEYKTTKLVLKYIPAGSFIMGEDQSDESHRVILTKPFYMGLFELTQKQWTLVMGERDFVYSNDTSPADNIAYNIIRGVNLGSQWPSSNAVDEDSFLGRLRTATGIAFDLPTDAQWEYACRAGTTTSYSCGDSVDSSYMWYSDNSSYTTHKVGTRTPNSFGLYDMHGNVWERCLDWYGDLSYGEDPVGVNVGTKRVVRGGGFDSPSYDLCASRRGDDSPDYYYKNNGFRLVLPFQSVESYKIRYSANDGSERTHSISFALKDEVTIIENPFSRDNYTFQGWATEKDGAVVYAAGDKAKSLTSKAGDIITLYAIWEESGSDSSAETEVNYNITDNGDGSCRLDGIEGDVPEKIVLPSVISNLKVTSIRTNAFENCSSIRSVVIPNSVMNIEHHAFLNCNNLTSITIPQSVKTIGDWALEGCSSLTSIVIPSSVTRIGDGVFKNCRSLTKIIIPSSVTSIGDYAFENCGFTSIIIPEGVVSMGEGAFLNTSNLESIIIPKDVTSIGYRTFYGCSSLASITIPDSVTSIGGDAFYGCSSLTSINIPDSVTNIGDYAFSGCSSLTSITIPDSVTNIGDYAFSGCSSLASIPIPDGVTSIGEGAFQGCSGLTSITIPEGVASIEASIFCGCSSLTSIMLPASVASIGWNAFSGCDSITNAIIPVCAIGSIPKSALVSVIIVGEGEIGGFAFCDSGNLTSITISDGVTSIGGGAFYGCSSLTSINIPDSVTNIGDYAFSGCSSLTSITIPDSVTNIGDYAFSGCSSLTSINIPDSVTSIGAWAFSGCDSITNAIIPVCAIGSIPKSALVSVIIVGEGEIGGFAFRDSGNLKSITIADGVTSIGNNAFNGCSSLASITIPDSVTSIGYSAFSGCSSLTSITIPDSVMSIGNWAFRDCSSLTSIMIPASVASIGWDAFGGCDTITNAIIPVCAIGSIPKSALVSVEIVGEGEIGNCAFQDSGNLKSITISDSVTSIGANAFSGCSSLTSITIPDSVTSIGGGAFSGCSSLTSITIPDSVTSIGGDAFYGCSSLTSINIPDSVTNIGDYAFSGCSSLTSITIPDSVTNIGVYAFSGCSGLTSITIPDSVTSIGGDAFYGCSSLTSINIPDSVTNIGDYAFSGCSSLTSITIPDSVTNIGVYAFSGCSGLTSITIPDSVTNIGWSAFSGCDSITNAIIPVCAIGSIPKSALVSVIIVGEGEIGNLAFSYSGNLKSITIPNSVTNIGGGAFFSCSSLTSITIPNSVTNIGEGAFQGCSGLTSINIPDSVTSIGDCAFYVCRSLTSITIPDSVTSIGNYAFYGCSSLKSVILPENASLEPYSFDSGTEEPCYIISNNGDGTCRLVRLNGVVKGKVVIPDTVEGLKVTSLGEGLFEGNEEITAIVIPETVTEFYRNTFCDMGSDDKPIAITLPHGLEHIWEGSEDSLTYHVFNADSTKSITFSNGKLSNDAGTYCLIGEDNRMLVHCESSNATNLIAYAGGSWNVGSGDYYINSPETIVVPDGVTSMVAYVLDDMESTKKISLPDSLIEMHHDQGLGWVVQLEKVEVRGTNSPYQVIGGSLVDTRKGLLIQATKNTVIPNDGSITKIARYSFISDVIKDVRIPDAVEELDEYAMRNMWRTETIQIGKGTCTIGGGAFAVSDAETLKYISISSENPYYEVVNGCVIQKVDNVFISTAVLQKSVKEDGEYKSDVEVPYFCTSVEGVSLDGHGTIRTVIFPKDLTLKWSGWVVPINCEGICIADCMSLTEAKASTTYKEFAEKGYLDTKDTPSLSYTSNPQVAVRTVGPVAVTGYGRYTPGEEVTLETTYVESGKQVVWYKVDRDSNTKQKVATGDTFTFAMPDNNVFYSAEIPEGIATPVITPEDGTILSELNCTVSISCETDGAAIYYTTNGVTPRLKEENLYTGPFEITGEAKIVAVAYKNGETSEYAEATITCKELEPLTLDTALDEAKLVNIKTGGDAEWVPLEDSSAKVGNTLVKSGAIGMEQTSWLEATVYGTGTLSFWWKISCEPDPRGRYTYDHITFAADGETKAQLDGATEWQEVSVTFTTSGAHTIRWTYSTDDWEEEGYQDCAWVDGVSWTGSAAPVVPTVKDDEAAVVTGDAEEGYVIVPSEGRTAVEVTIPDGMDAAKVTVEVSPEVETVVPNGTAVRVVRGTSDITKYLDIPKADASGIVDLSAAKVRDEYVKEALDTTNDAKIDFSAPDKPSLTTAPTREGLVYRLKEGTTLEAMKANTSGDSKVGDGKPWEPTITVKGGSSGFYTIEVSK